MGSPLEIPRVEIAGATRLTPLQMNSLLFRMKGRHTRLAPVAQPKTSSSAAADSSANTPR